MSIFKLEINGDRAVLAGVVFWFAFTAYLLGEAPLRVHTSGGWVSRLYQPLDQVDDHWKPLRKCRQLLADRWVTRPTPQEILSRHEVDARRFREAESARFLEFVTQQ